MKKNLPSRTLILGGASSGKSKFAESLVFSTGFPRTYVATAQAWDDEMRAKISAHQAQRGPGWTTVEAPTDLCAALKNVASDHVILLDCLTLWLTNLMLADADIDAELTALAACLQNLPNPIVIVSNEIGQGVVPDNAMARRFVTIQGRANQHIAALCETVALVTAGLPQVLKGTL